jgi:hypothetical protein
MGKWRGKLRKVADKVGEGFVVIPQRDGTVLRFDEGERGRAWAWEAERMRRIWRGEDPGPAHPFTVAQRNAAYPDEYEKNQLDADRQPRRGEAS